MKPIVLFLFLGLLVVVGPTAAQQQESYVLTMAPGMNPIANQLENGGNTLSELMPNVPDGCALYDISGQNFVPIASYTGQAGWTPNLTLPPGKGAFLTNPGPAFTLTFTGVRRTPVLPIPEIYQGGQHLLCRQVPEPVMSYEEIAGAPPCGPVTIARFNRAVWSWDYASYDPETGWSFGYGLPLAQAGEPVLIDFTTACAGQLPFTLNGSINKTVPCGSEWSFDPPTWANACPGADPAISVLSTITNGVCPIVITRTWEAIDACNNRATCSQAVSITNRTPPVLSGCTNIVVKADPGQTNAVVRFSVEAGTGCGGPASVICSPENGSTFQQGITAVHCTATDACGNQSTCEFTVTVEVQLSRLDYFVEDTPVSHTGLPDIGREPDLNMAGQNMWSSRAIWVHETWGQPEGTYLTHQNPRFGQTNCILVNVQNRGGSLGAAELEVYVANASLGLAWPAQWVLVGTYALPTIAPNSSHIARLPWWPAGTGHYCLLARVKSTDDPMTTPELANIGTNVRANNNLAWRNVNVVNLLRTTGQSAQVRLKALPRVPAAAAALNNIHEPKPPRQSVNVVCKTETIFHEGRGEAIINLGPLFKRWQEAGGHGQNITVIGDTTVRITNTLARIDGIPLDDDEEAIINLTVLGPHPVQVADTQHTCQVDLTEEMDGEPVGGVSYGVLMRALHTDTDHDGIVDVDDPDDDGDGVPDAEDLDPLGEPDCPPSALTIRRVDGQTVLSWNGLGYRLEASSVIDRAWRPLHGATSPYLVNESDDYLFFRLVCH